MFGGLASMSLPWLVNRTVVRNYLIIYWLADSTAQTHWASIPLLVYEAHAAIGIFHPGVLPALCTSVVYGFVQMYWKFAVMQRLQCCSQYLFAVVDATVAVVAVNTIVRNIAAVALAVKYQFAVVDATVAVLQSTPVCRSYIVDVVFQSTPVCISWCNSCSVAVNSMQFAVRLMQQLQSIL